MGAQPCLKAAVDSDIDPILQLAWLDSAPVPEPIHDADRLPGSSRAPPAPFFAEFV
jgi:hypothetical protein